MGMGAAVAGCQLPVVGLPVAGWGMGP